MIAIVLVGGAWILRECHRGANHYRENAPD
jgi:hypothetical protein